MEQDRNSGRLRLSLKRASRILKVPGRWKTDEDWDGLKLKIDRRAAEQMAERIASERVSLNAQHYKLWGVVVGKLFESLQTGLKGDQIRDLERIASVLDRAQKGQRLARGLSLDGKTEEQIRAEFEAEGRGLIDFFMDLVKDFGEFDCRRGVDQPDPAFCVRGRGCTRRGAGPWRVGRANRCGPEITARWSNSVVRTGSRRTSGGVVFVRLMGR